MMIDLATHTIARAQKQHLEIINMHLHKVLYFTCIRAIQQGLLSKEALEQVYDIPFEVWRYGPTIREVYDKYSIYGASSLFMPEKEIEAYDFLNPIIDALLEENLFDLVRESRQHPHWKHHAHEIERGKSTATYSLENLVHPGNINESTQT